MKTILIRHAYLRRLIYILLVCLPTVLEAIPRHPAPLDSVDTEGAIELDATTAHKELQQYLPKSLDADLALLMETWRTGYATQQRFEVPCGSYNTEDIRSLSDSVIISRLNALPTVIPIPYNAIVKEGIATYISDRPRLIRVILALGDYYFPIMEEILDRHGLPVELVYLTIVESALNPFATSPVGATGLWQFMLPTGRSMGLTINSLVDERLDVYKSTEAAAIYLKQLYELFDNWLLAIAAYNCGPGNVSKAIRRSGGETTFWGVYPYLPRETRNYIPLFIGAYYACYYHNEYNICPQAQTMPLATDTLAVQIPLTFTQISQSCGIPTEQIRTLNPQYKRGVIPAAGSTPYIIRLPLEVISRLDEALINLRQNHQQALSEQIAQAQKEIKKAPQKSTHSYKTYKVRRGDSLAKIAKRHGVSVATLKRVNGLKGRNPLLRPGQRLKIPK